MTTNLKKPVGLGALFGAMGAAIQWRLWLVWILAMLLPTLIIALPLRTMLGGFLDHSVHASAWARHFDALAMGDVIVGAGRNAMGLPGASSAALLVTLLLSPFLTGMVVAAARLPRSATMGELVHGGVSEYWRMFRLMLWALLPFGVAFVVGSIAMKAAGNHADMAVLQSAADRGNHIAQIVMGVLLVVAHAMVESGRAQFAADPQLRSATRAFFRGAGIVFRRPLATFGLYLGVSIVGYVLVLLLGMWRIRTDAVGAVGFLLALLLSQLIVVVLAWQRTARLFALAEVARATPSGRRAGQGSLAHA